MTTEQAKQLSDDAIVRLVEALEKGQSDALKNYLAVMARFHTYSWGNCMLIYSQRPNATRVAGFHAWLKLRRYVRKGERGILILAPMIGKKKSEENSDCEAESRLIGFRGTYIFDGLSRDSENPTTDSSKPQGLNQLKCYCLCG